MTKRPFDDLNNAVGKQVLVKLKDNNGVRGVLRAFDVHLNLVLEEAEELAGNEAKAKYGKIMLRGDNIILISI